MASTSETGHNKNISNLASLITHCKEYGTDYQPANIAITITQLDNLYNRCTETMNQLNTARTLYDNAVNNRKETFSNLRTLSTRITHALAACGASGDMMENAKAINKKIQGRSAGKPKSLPQTPNSNTSIENPEPSGDPISTSQTSYDSKIEFFTHYIHLLENEPKYTPNETELNIAGLKTKQIQLKTANKQLVEAYVRWSNARISRSQTLYHPETGITAIANDIKSYIRSHFGAGSPQSRQVTNLRFHTPSNT